MNMEKDISNLSYNDIKAIPDVNSRIKVLTEWRGFFRSYISQLYKHIDETNLHITDDTPLCEIARIISNLDKAQGRVKK